MNEQQSKLDAMQIWGELYNSEHQLTEEKILDALSRSAIKYANVADLHIAFFDRDSNLIRFRISVVNNKRVETPPRTANRDKLGLVETIILSKKSTLLRNSEETKNWFDIPRHSNFFENIPTAYMGVPLIISKISLGMIGVYTFEKGREFNELDIALLSLMASRAAIALENVKLVESLEIANVELLQAQEREIFAALGEVSAGLIHKMGNTIGAIPALTTRIEKTLDPKDENTLRKLQAIKSGVTDALDYVGSMGKILELQKITESEANLCLLIHNGIRQTQQLLDENSTKLKVECDDSITVNVNAPLMIEVFRNIIENATEAMPSGGNLRILCSQERNDVIIKIIDAGCGISQENAANLFRLGFSTKKEGKGIGLWFVKTVIERHQGSISFQSEPSKGTTFQITLPADYPVDLV